MVMDWPVQITLSEAFGPVYPGKVYDMPVYSETYSGVAKAGAGYDWPRASKDASPG